MVHTRDSVYQGAMRHETRIRKFDHDCDDGHTSQCVPFDTVELVEWELPTGERIDASDPRFAAWERRYQEEQR